MSTPTDLPHLISPIVPDSLAHNTRTLSKIHPPLSFLLGLCAGILSLHSLYGFGFYLGGTLTISVLIRVFLVVGGKGGSAGAVGEYFPSSSGRGRSSSGTGSGGESVDGKGKGEGGGGSWSDVFWLFGGVMEGLSGFVLGWAGGGGVLR